MEKVDVRVERLKLLAIFITYRTFGGVPVESHSDDNWAESSRRLHARGGVNRTKSRRKLWL